MIDTENEAIVDSVIGWHYEVIETDELSRCLPFCYSMPLTDAYVRDCEMEVMLNVTEQERLQSNSAITCRRL